MKERRYYFLPCINKLRIAYTTTTTPTPQLPHLHYNYHPPSFIPSPHHVLSHLFVVLLLPPLSPHFFIPHLRSPTEAKQRCQDDFLLLRRLLQEQGRPLRGPQQVFPWFFPMFRVPYLPEQGKDETDVVKKPTHADEIPQQEEENFGVHEGSEPTDGDYEEDSPTPGPEWHILPYLPEVPVRLLKIYLSTSSIYSSFSLCVT